MGASVLCVPSSALSLFVGLQEGYLLVNSWFDYPQKIYLANLAQPGISLDTGRPVETQQLGVSQGVVVTVK